MSKGRRMSVWIPEEDLWIDHLIEKRVQTSEKLGIKTTAGEQVRLILKQALRKDHQKYIGEEDE